MSEPLADMDLVNYFTRLELIIRDVCAVIFFINLLIVWLLSYSVHKAKNVLFCQTQMGFLKCP